MRVLSLSSALCLSSCAAAAVLPFQGSGSNAQTSTNSYEIMLPCAECAFADRRCSRSEDTITSSYFTLKLTTHDDTLFANDQPIFPPPTPMKLQFHATHYEGSNQHYFNHNDVQVAYAIDARPVSPKPGSPLADIFHLKMKFLDLHGRPATDDLVSIVLQTTTNGLTINDVQPTRNTKSPLSTPKKPPMSLADMIATMYSKTPSRPSTKLAPQGAAVDQPSSSSSSRDGGDGVYDNFALIPPPVLLQALLAVSCGILACLAMLVIEWAFLSVRKRFARRSWWRSGRALPQPIPVLTVEGEIVREEFCAEKKLVEVDLMT